MTTALKLHPYFKKPRVPHAHASGAGPWAVPDLCAAYAWPRGLAGGGVIAIVELGGGWIPSDMAVYFASIHQPLPQIMDISVDGTKNTPGGDADGEVALDIQVAAAAYYAATGKTASIHVSCLLGPRHRTRRSRRSQGWLRRVLDLVGCRRGGLGRGLGKGHGAGSHRGDSFRYGGARRLRRQ
jgi:hypothetical protein